MDGQNGWAWAPTETPRPVARSRKPARVEIAEPSLIPEAPLQQKPTHSLWQKRAVQVEVFRRRNGWSLLDCAFEFGTTLKHLMAGFAEHGIHVEPDREEPVFEKRCCSCGVVCIGTRFQRMCRDCAGSCIPKDWKKS